MNTYRIVIERTTVERTEIEVQAETLTGATYIANRYPDDVTRGDRRRFRVAREFADGFRSRDHEVISAREV